MIKNLVWLTLVASMILIGCKKPDSSIGLENLPDSDFFTLGVETLHVDIVTVRENALDSKQHSTALLGKVFHPRIGETQALFASQLRLSSPNQVFGDNPVADSIQLRLRHTGVGYGEFSQHKIEVRQLVDSIVLDSIYYTSYEPEAIHGSLVAPSHPSVSIQPVKQTIVDSDTSAAYLTIDLDTGFGQSLLDLNPEIYSSNDNWLEYFPGIIVSSTSGHGATRFNINSSASMMRLYYHNDEDTTHYDFEFSEYSLRLNLFYNNYVSALDGLNAFDEDSAYVKGDKLLYVMGGGGLNLKMNIPGLEALEDSIGPDRSVQKAELVLKVDEEVSEGIKIYSDRFNPKPAMLYIGLKNDVFITPTNVFAEYNSSENTYSFILTGVIQDMLNYYSGMGPSGTFDPSEDLPSLYIIPTNPAESLEGVILKGTGVDEASTKLVVTYSH